MRIVSLLPSATEILFALGFDREVVGVSHECDFPPQARNKRVVIQSRIPKDAAPLEIDRLVRNFLEMLFTLGMLEGPTSEDAYYVSCDATTNLASETDLGRVICEIGVQPPYPAEFVVVTVGITRDGVQVREERERNA